MANPSNAELRRLVEALPKNCSPYTRAYAEFRDKANPATVLSLLDECERLQATCDGLDRQNDAIAEEIGKVAAERDAALAELARLRALLLEASEEIAAWGAYASDYFQEKHGLEASVAKFHDAAMSQEVGHG